MPPPWGAYIPAVLCLGFFTSARVAEQVQAGIQSLPRGQRMAGTALGLTLPQTYRYVLLPMAFRIVLPPLTSEFMNVIKNSSVALTIGLVELTAAARSMQEFSFQVFEAFTAATIDLHPGQRDRRLRHARARAPRRRSGLHRPAGADSRGPLTAPPSATDTRCSANSTSTSSSARFGYLFKEGMTFTLTLTALAMTGGVIFGTLLAMMRLSTFKLLAARRRRAT